MVLSRVEGLTTLSAVEGESSDFISFWMRSKIPSLAGIKPVLNLIGDPA
jgi:hypothetical protein